MNDRRIAVVLHHRTPGLTRTAVESLLASSHPPDELLVVDNDDDAGDGKAFLQGLAPRVTWLHTGANLGFTGGMNAGISAAMAREAATILLANSDVEVERDCLALLHAALDQDHHAGVVAPLVLHADRRDTVESMGLSWSAMTGRMRHRGTGRAAATLSLAAPHVVDAVSGSLMLFRRSALERVGAFDDRFFFGFEEIDLCLRLGRAGLSSLVVPAARIWHVGGGTMGLSPDRLYYAARNHLLLSSKVAAAGENAVLRGLRTSVIVALNLAHAVRADGGSLARRLSAVCAGVRDYTNGRFGPAGSPSLSSRTSAESTATSSSSRSMRR